jgi:Flp pilus assembly pilin Flp
LNCERGGVSIEYALLALFLGIGIIAGLKSTKSGLQQNYDALSYGMTQTASASSLTVRKVYAASPLSEGGYNYMQVTTSYYAPGTTACPCTAKIVRTPVDPKNTPYQLAVFDIDANNAIVGVTTTNNDGSISFDKITALYPGVNIVAHQDSTSSYTYREASTVVSTGVSAVTRTFMSGTGSPWQSYQYVVDQSVAGQSNYIGTVQKNNDGTVVKTGQDISSYF